MKKEQEEAIKECETLKKCLMQYSDKPENIKTGKAIETILSMLKEKDAEIEKKDNTVKKIINRLNNDIKRIAKSKAENSWDDYRRCRLKAYKTKIREIKEYIEEQYFKRRSEE